MITPSHKVTIPKPGDLVVYDGWIYALVLRSRYTPKPHTDRELSLTVLVSGSKEDWEDIHPPGKIFRNGQLIS